MTQEMETTSMLNDDNFNWNVTKESIVPIDKIIMIRMVHPDTFFNQLDTTSFPKHIQEALAKSYEYLEECTLAKWNGNEWLLEPPFPLYNYSPFTDNNKIKNDVIVEHWTEVTDELIDNWHRRFDFINDYKHLKLEVDEEHKHDVYTALLHGAAALNAINNDELIKYRDILYDLQSSLDKGE